MAIKVIPVILVSMFMPLLAQAPESTLELRNVIDIVADFEIQHPRVPYATSWYGLTDFDNQVIYSIRNADFITRRMSMIHELLHVDRRARGVNLPNQDEEEMAVRSAAESMYKQLFGATK